MRFTQGKLTTSVALVSILGPLLTFANAAPAEMERRNPRNQPHFNNDDSILMPRDNLNLPGLIAPLLAFFPGDSVVAKRLDAGEKDKGKETGKSKRRSENTTSPSASPTPTTPYPSKSLGSSSTSGTQPGGLPSIMSSIIPDHTGGHRRKTTTSDQISSSASPTIPGSTPTSPGASPSSPAGSSTSSVSPSVSPTTISSQTTTTATFRKSHHHHHHKSLSTSEVSSSSDGATPTLPSSSSILSTQSTTKRHHKGHSTTASAFILPLPTQSLTVPPVISSILSVVSFEISSIESQLSSLEATLLPSSFTDAIPSITTTSLPIVPIPPTFTLLPTLPSILSSVMSSIGLTKPLPTVPVSFIVPSLSLPAPTETFPTTISTTTSGLSIIPPPLSVSSISSALRTSPLSVLPTISVLSIGPSSSSTIGTILPTITSATLTSPGILSSGLSVITSGQSTTVESTSGTLIFTAGTSETTSTGFIVPSSSRSKVTLHPNFSLATTVTVPPLTSPGHSVQSTTVVTVGPEPIPSLFSVVPTGTNSLTVVPVQSSLFLQSSTQTLVPAPSSLPSDVPGLIQPPGGKTPSAPANSTLIQIGLLYGLNYPFVVNRPASARQIFLFLPYGLSFGLQIPPESITMHSLQPYNTTSELGYITTLCLAWIPSNLVDPLTLDIHTAISRLYQNPDPTTNGLMSMINPAIPILPGAAVASGGVDGDLPVNPEGAAGFASGTSPSFSGGAPLGAGGQSNGSVKSSSVGIGVGVVAGAAVVGAAMFYLGRWYTDRRQKSSAHRRSSSLIIDGAPAPEMDQSYGVYPSLTNYGLPTATNTGRSPPGTAAAAAGGASRPSYGRNGGSNGTQRDSRGSDGSQARSVRSQGISRPLMSENSLGWH